MNKRFRVCDLSQPFLIPPSLHGLEIEGLGKDADKGHVLRLDLEIATLARCHEECQKDNKPVPGPVPDEVTEENWWEFMKRTFLPPRLIVDNVL